LPAAPASSNLPVAFGPGQPFSKHSHDPLCRDGCLPTKMRAKRGIGEHVASDVFRHLVHDNLGRLVEHSRGAPFGDLLNQRPSL
jgi:hypothetical protein